MKRALRFAFYAVLSAVVFTAALGAGALLHLRLAVTRALLTREVSFALASTFAGRVVIDRVDSVSLGGLRGASVQVFDPAGVRVIAVDNLTVRLSAVGAVSALVDGTVLDIDRVDIGSADVSLDDTSSGLRIANAFALRTAASAPSAPSMFRLSIRDIAVHHAWVHGVTAGTRIDAEVDGAIARLSVARAGVIVVLDDAAVLTRAMPRGANPRGHVSARLLYADEIHLRGAFGGDVGGIAARVAAALDDDGFIVRADVPETAPERVRALAPEVPLSQSVSVHAVAEGQIDAFAFHAHAGIGAATVIASGHLVHGHVLAVAEARGIDLRAFGIKAKTTLDGDARITMDDGTVRANGHVDSPGGHAALSAEIDDHHIAGEVTGSVTSIAQLAKPFVPHAQARSIDGHGAFHARGRFDRDGRRIDVTTSMRFEGLTAGWAAAGVFDASAHVEGLVSNPTLAVDVDAERLVLPRMAVTSARARLRGRLRNAALSLRVNANGPFDANAHVALDERGALAVDGLRITSDGQLIIEGALELDSALLGGDAATGRGHVKLAAHKIDLALVSRTLGLDVAADGHVGLDVDMRVADGALDGRALLDVSGLDYGDVRGLDARVEAASVAGGWSLVSRARMRDVGWLSIESAALRPSGSVLDASAWRRATGSLNVATSVDVGSIDRLLYRESRVTGFASVALVVRRTEASAPDVTLDASTANLTIAGIAERVDLKSHAHVDPRGQVDVHVQLGRGTGIGSADVRTDVSWGDALVGKLPDLETLPFTAEVAVPSRESDELCKMIGVRCHGTIGVTAHIDGPVSAPHGKATVKVSAFRSSVSPIGEAIDATVDGTYVGGVGTAKVLVTRTGSPGTILDASASVHVPAEHGWYGSLDATLKGVPLRAPPDYVDWTMGATLDGHVSITDLHRSATAKVDLDASAIDIEGVHSDHAKVNVTFDGSKLAGDVHLNAPDGYLALHVDGAATWGAAFVPALDTRAPLAVSLRASNFRARNLMPLVPPSVGEIDGRIDADASARLAFATAHYELKGWAKVAHGDIQSSSLGEMHDIQGTVASKADGSFTLENAEVHGATGLVKLSGAGRVAGGALEEVKLSASIRRADAFPIVVGGNKLGDGWGHLTASIRPKAHGLAVAVDVPSFHVVMPDLPNHALQDLTAAKTITVGVRKRSGDILPVALSPPSPVASSGVPITIAVTLGDDVQIERGEMLKVLLTGTPIVELGGEGTRIHGGVTLVRGTLEVEGKRFDIEHGIVTFTGEPDNPTLVVTATWDAADGTHVIADYVGPLKSGKLTLHADPPRTQDEIVALIVFGSTEGLTPSSGSGGNGMTTTAIAEGASFATQPLNKAIDQLTHLDVRARIDTSGAAAKSEVEVQIAKGISAQVAYVFGLPPPGTAPDLTWLTLACRVSTHWSLDFTVGDHGSSIIDALWRVRY